MSTNYVVTCSLQTLPEYYQGLIALVEHCLVRERIHYYLSVDTKLSRTFHTLDQFIVLNCADLNKYFFSYKNQRLDKVYMNYTMKTGI